MISLELKLTQIRLDFSAVFVAHRYRTFRNIFHDTQISKQNNDLSESDRILLESMKYNLFLLVYPVAFICHYQLLLIYFTLQLDDWI